MLLLLLVVFANIPRESRLDVPDQIQTVPCAFSFSLSIGLVRVVIVDYESSSSSFPNTIHRCGFADVGGRVSAYLVVVVVVDRGVVASNPVQSVLGEKRICGG